MPSDDRRAFLSTVSAGIAGAALPLPRPQEVPPAAAEAEIGRKPKVRFAINVEMWWTRLPFLDRIRRAAALGFPAVEFWPWQGKDLPAIAALCRELRIEVAQFLGWGFAPGLTDPASHDAFVAAIEQGCAAARELGSRQMTVLAGNDQPGRTREELHQAVIAALRRAAKVAEAAQVMLILEPLNTRVDHAGYSVSDSPAAVRICREVASPMVKINWDLYHLQIMEGDLCGHLREGFDQVGYLQFADHPGRHEPGTGEISYRRVFQAAWELGYRGFAGAELSPAGDEVQAARAVAAVGTW